jgi:hypothetical protein
MSHDPGKKNLADAMEYSTKALDLVTKLREEMTGNISQIDLLIGIIKRQMGVENGDTGSTPSDRRA